MDEQSLTAEALNTRSIKQHYDIVLKGDGTKAEFIYHGLWPDAPLKKKMVELFMGALEFTPINSSIRARVECCQNGFKMFFMLSFAEGSIFAINRGATPKKALQRTFDQVHSKIRKWRSDRHLTGDSVATAPATEVWKFTPRVLIVDDNPVSIKLIESCLRQQGCNTNIVTDGAHAIRELTRKDYDLVVLDWLMPDLNGAETLVCAQDIISYDSTFRSPWGANQMPVITYSGADQSRINFPECENFELMGHIAKSSTFSQLTKATSEVLHSLQLV